MRLDQFYTKPEIVESVIASVDFDEFDYIIEPSAGAGDFLNRLPEDKRVGVDLEPASPEIIKSDFFDFIPKTREKVLTIGNPPFGKNSSLAVKFFNRAAEYSECIAFIVPRTFRKPSLVNRLHPKFHLVEQTILPVGAFYLPEGGDYNVPTVFQIWRRREQDRTKIQTVTSHSDFDFVKIISNPASKDKERQRTLSDFCVRRVGAGAGTVYESGGEKYRDWKSHYYIKQNGSNVRETMESIDWNYLESPKYDTAGNPSISKNDLINFYTKQKEVINNEA